MAGETTYADLVTNGGRTAEVLSPLIHQILFDATNLAGLVAWDPSDVAGSSVQETAKLGAPPAAAAVSSETSGGTSNSAMATTSVQVTIACQEAHIQLTDLFAITSGVANGLIDVQTALRWLSNAQALRITDMLTTLFSSLSTNSVGSGSGDAMTVDHFYSAMYKLNTSLVPSDRVALVLAPKSHNELVESLRGEGGSLQWQADVAEMLAIKGPGYKGSLRGVDIWQSDSITNSGGAYKNAMFGYSTFKGRLGPVPWILGQQMVDPADVVMSTPTMFIERSRDTANNMTSFYLKFYAGIAELEDARGCLVNVDS